MSNAASMRLLITNILTRGLIEQARTEFTEMTAPIVSYADIFEDDDDDE